MSSQNLIRLLVGITGLNLAVAGYTLQHHNKVLDDIYEENEARMDELEGTLRGHIGLIEESLQRIEEISAKAAGKESGWGKGMGKHAEEMYGKRGRDEKNK